MKITLLLACCVLVFASNLARGEETDPNEIFKKVQAAYAALETLSVQGTVVKSWGSDRMPGKVTMKATYSLKMKKPNQYLFTWDRQIVSESQGIPVPPKSDKGSAVWSDGQQPYFCTLGMSGLAASYCKLKDNAAAIKIPNFNATGCEGDLRDFPGLFFPEFAISSPFSQLVDPKLQKSERVAGEDCYVIGHQGKIFKRATYWISKKTFFVRQYVHSVETSDEIHEITVRDQVNREIEKSGQKLTEEQRAARMEDERKKARAQQKNEVKGTETTVYAKIDSPKFTDADFVFKIPPGTRYEALPFVGLPEKVASPQ